MFDLEQAIAKWRGRMADDGIKSPEVLDELESHLREGVQEQMQSGLNLQRAYEIASRRIGHANELKKEFNKVGWVMATQARMKRAVHTFAGVPDDYISTSMNTPYSELEPGWATYLKAAAFLVPAVCLWTLSATFVVPKLNEVCYQAHLENEIAIWNLTRYNFGILFLLKDNWIIIAGAIILLLGLLEWRSHKWPRYRRATIGVGTFLLNALLLISFFIMIITGTVAASELLRHAR